MLLQRAVEEITGEPLDQFMEASLFERAHMNSSGYVWNDRIAKAFVPVFTADGGITKPKPFTTAVAASSLYTNVADYPMCPSAAKRLIENASIGIAVVPSTTRSATMAPTIGPS